MKPFFTLLLMCSISLLFGQNDPKNETKGLFLKDSLGNFRDSEGNLISEIEKNKSFEKLQKFKANKNHAAVLLDSVLVHPNIMTYLNPNEIEKINVVKGTVIISGEKYNGQILITTKKPKDIHLISLEEIKHKFTKSKKQHSIFMINGQFIKNEIETIKIDERFIHNVNLLDSDYFENLKNQKINVDIVSITTKKPENLKPKIILRGNETGESIK